MLSSMRTGNWDEGTVFDGGVTTYTIDVQPGDPELKITLAWDDVPGTPNISPALVNDLDLVVIDPSGTRHYPWTIPLGSPGSPAVKTAEDHLNNIEQVQVDSPQAGRWMMLRDACSCRRSRATPRVISRVPFPASRRSS